MLTVTINRASLSLPELVIPGMPDPSPSFWIPQGGITSPEFAWRYRYAPDSADYPGRQLLSAVLDASTLPLQVMVEGFSTASLAARQRELEAAVSQFSYQVTVAINGETQTWAADPAWPSWGELDFGMTSHNLARAALVIPINP